MDETPEGWVERLFEFEYCPECGGDAGDHEVCLVPGIGNYFARCLRGRESPDHGEYAAPLKGPTDMGIDTGGVGMTNPHTGGERPMKITASCKFGDHDIKDIPVLNPGGWFGKAWLIEIGGGYTPLFLVVEADSVTDAIDELSDDPTFGPQVHVSDEDLGDYPENERRYDGSGRVIDLDWVAVHGREGCDLPYSIEYHVGDEPVAFDPRRFAAWQHN
ncbi:hypothetical protein [Paludisphaera soli]|uniref:hypothetical protein n=1 Tax=Paludisphaera soli TaxID=2712865 RepID=UPI0013ED5863|nr:hypothetical protein [Paludisphaera soli]